MIVPEEAVLEKLNPLASKAKEEMETYVPPVTATSNPSATLPSVEQTNCPDNQVSLLEELLQLVSPPPW